jgi:hypothetical protein
MAGGTGGTGPAASEGGESAKARKGAANGSAQAHSQGGTPAVARSPDALTDGESVAGPNRKPKADAPRGSIAEAEQPTAPAARPAETKPGRESDATARSRTADAGQTASSAGETGEPRQSATSGADKAPSVGSD